MRRLGILAFLMIAVIIGGVISTGMLSAPLSGLLITQTSDPNASPFVATPQQSMQIVFWAIFVISNVLVVAIVLALVFWLINRMLVSERGNRPAASASSTDSEAATE